MSGITGRKSELVAQLRGWSRTALIVVSCLTVPAEGAPTQAKPDRVQAFLTKAREANSPAGIIALVEKAKLTETETKQVAQELGKPEWAEKLASLKTKLPASKPRVPTPTARPGKTDTEFLAERRKLVEKVQASRIADALAEVKAARASRPTNRANPVRPRPRSVSASLRPGPALGRDAPQPTYPATIGLMYPAPAIAGRLLSLRGVGFGQQPGRVYFLVGEDLIESTVSAWKDAEIVTTTPYELMPWDRAGDVPAECPTGRTQTPLLPSEVWVRLADGRWGGGYHIHVAPHPSILLPEITRFIPNEITPGGELLIRGRNFGNAPGTSGGPILRLSSVPLDAALVVVNWMDDEILVRMKADVKDVYANSNARIDLTNRFGRTTGRNGLKFTPTMTVKLLDEYPHLYATCRPAALPPFCLAGESRTVTMYNRQLARGWTVDGIWLNVEVTGAGGGAYFDGGPPIGATNTESTVVVWADPLSQTRGSIQASAVGPRGTWEEPVQ